MTFFDRGQSLSPRQNFVWTFLGNTVYLATQWAMLMALAKLGTTEIVGQFSLGLAIASPVIIGSQMQLRQAYVTDVKNEFHFFDYLWHRFFFTLLAVGIIVLFLISSRYSFDMCGIILLIGLSKGFESMSDIVYGRFQKCDRMDFIAVSMMLKGISTLLVFILCLKTTNSLMWALAGMLFIWAFFLFFFDFLISNKLTDEGSQPYQWRWLTCKRLTRLVFPLSFSSFMISLSGSIPRYFLEFYHGKSSVGMFAIASTPLNFITMLHGALGQSIMAKAARHFQRREYPAFKQLALKLTGIFMLIGILFTTLFLLFGNELITVLFSKEYLSTIPALVVMAAGITLSSFHVFGALVLTAGRLFNWQLLQISFTVLVQIIAGFFLISKYGVVGAAWTDFIKTFAGACFFSMTGFLSYKKIQGIKGGEHEKN